MATIEKQQAIDLLTRAIRHARADDVVEIYNELFPETPTTDGEAAENLTALVEKVIRHVDNGLEVEEVIDLWNVVFPTHHSVWFDEEDGLLHYDEKVEQVGLAD